MTKPLVVACFHDTSEPQVARLAVDYELLLTASLDEMASRDLPRPPRLFVIQASTQQAERACQVLTALRRNWPLTDVLLWSAKGSGAAVRAFFQAGAKDVVVSSSVAELGERIRDTLEHQQILPRMNELSRRRKSGSRFESMLSRSEAMWDLFDLCTRVATANATVLIVGETGTGKELLARALHRRSERRGRFVAANCASIPPDLINSELFGHEKGAFTGADRAKKGLVMHANGGTLFLDEIGDMPAEAQLSLLRMLQEKRIRPVGSQIEQEVDVRIVAATNILLDKAVSLGDFREDLFYRLDVIRMNVPALRERPEDILLLFGHFTKQLAKNYGLDPPTFSDDFLDALMAYAWPGNVRQLENFCERLVLARPQRVLRACDFERLRTTNLTRGREFPARPQIARDRSTVDLSIPLRESLAPLIERYEKDYLTAVLQQHGGRVAAAAKQAGVSRRTMLRKMNQYGIDKREFKS